MEKRRCWIDIWITVSLISYISPADRGQKILGVSLLPPIWPNIYIWGSVIIPWAPPVVLGGNWEKTHNGIYLLCGCPAPGQTQVTISQVIIPPSHWFSVITGKQPPPPSYLTTWLLCYRYSQSLYVLTDIWRKPQIILTELNFLSSFPAKFCRP